MGTIGNGVRPHSASVASPLSLGGRNGGMARVKAGESIGAQVSGTRHCEPEPPGRTTRRTGRTYARPQPSLAPWQVQLAKKIMAARVGETMQVSELSCACRLSMSYFVRAFTSTVGISPYSWFIGQRVLRAMILLSHSRMPIAEIALECGFADQSHFTNTFVRRAGKTPRQWRQEATRAQPPTAPETGDGALAASVQTEVARRGDSSQSAARNSAIRAVQSSCTRRPSSSTRSANQFSSSSVIR